MKDVQDNLLGYVLNALDPDEHQQVENQLPSCQASRDSLDRLRLAVAPLAADRADPEPPANLAIRTLQRIAAFRPRAFPAAPEVAPSQPGGRDWWRRADFAAMAAMLLVGFGLAFAWVSASWHQARNLACKENLHKFYAALAAYSEQRPDGAFPRIEQDGPRSLAGVFVPVLADAGVLPEGISVSCPADGVQSVSRSGQQVAQLEEWYDNDPTRYHRVISQLGAGYAYSLGYRQGDGVTGLRRGQDHTPILSDRPPITSRTEVGGGNSPNHGGRGQNVLFVDGSVRYTTTRTFGVGQDDIFVNVNRRVQAGAHVGDTVLGSGASSP